MSRAFVLSDLAEVNAWYRARSLGELSPASLPAIGEIVSGVAVGFLYRCEGGFLIIEGYVTNPSATRRQRAAALRAITKALLAKAAQIPGSRLLAFCKARSIVRLAQQHGLHVAGTYTLAVGGT